MSEVFSYKGKFFLRIKELDVPAPLPGDVVTKRGEWVRSVLSSEIYKDRLELTLLGEKTWIPGKGGKKVWVAELKTIEVNKDNLSDYIFKRANHTLYPLPVAQKIINFFIKLIIKVKSKFSKKEK